MPAEKGDRPVQFISKLVQLTQDRKINWTSAPSPDANQSSGSAFTTDVNDRTLRLYKARREVTADDFLAAALGTVKRRVVYQPVLEVLDEFGQVSYSFEDTTGLGDLHEAAAFSASNVDELMDSILRRK